MAYKLRSLFLCCFSLAFFHCVDPTSAGLRAFHAASYPEAAREFARLDPARLPPRDASRLQLYSGLTALALGDVETAVPRLDALRLALARDGGLLSAEDQVRLETAWQALGLMPGEAPP